MKKKYLKVLLEVATERVDILRDRYEYELESKKMWRAIARNYKAQLEYHSIAANDEWLEYIKNGQG